MRNMRGELRCFAGAGRRADEPIVRVVADNVVGVVGTMSVIGEIGGIGREVIETVLIGEIGKVAGSTSE